MKRIVLTPKTGEPALSERFERALLFAVETHRKQRRKGTEIPYIGHLLGVCSLVIEDGGTEDEAIAALLHDAAEDQGGEQMLERIRAEFGDHVADIVRACSDTLEDPKPPWLARKKAYLAHLDEQPAPVLRVSLADKLFNARAILRDYRSVGDELWQRFQTGREEQLWYYNELADAFARLCPGPMARELGEVVSELERAATHVLPDVIDYGLRLLICGSAAGAASAKAGAYYAGPGNKFWEVLHEVGLTPETLKPSEFKALLAHGIGLTDASKVSSGADKAIPEHSLDSPRLLRVVEIYRPKIVAFNGKKAAQAVLGKPVDYGHQSKQLAGADVFVLPSTSAAARAFWDIGPWKQLASAFAEG